MNTRKTALFLSFFLSVGAAAAVASSAAPLFAGAEGQDESIVNTPLSKENSALFLPELHEEYLPLTAPKHAAFSDDYIAVADGATLYVYDRAAQTYTAYEHRTGDDTTTLSELQFAPDGTLYFTDQSTALFTYDFAAAQSVRQPISCSTFLLADDSVYYATTTGTNTVTFFYVPLSDPTATPTRIRECYPAANPRLAYENGTLSCVYNNDTLIKFAKSSGILSESDRLDNKQVSDLQYVCAYGGSLYYTVSGTQTDENGLYRTTDGRGEKILSGNNLTTLTVYDGKLYCVQGSSVKEIAVTENGASFTGYEIASASSSPNRLADAVNTARAGNLLVTADNGNDRVTVYNFATQEYSVVPCPNVKLVATDGNTVAMSDGATLYSFVYGREEEMTSTQSTSGEYIGIACFFSDIYYVTRNNIYGKLGTERTIPRDYGTPTSLTCDLYGTLYVSYHTGAVYAFTEDEFLTNGGKEAYARFDKAPEVLRADFEGNLYYLSEGTLYKNGEVFVSFPSDPFLYHGAQAPVSFALGFEDDRVYFNFGDYVLVTNEGALDIPTLGKISLENAKEQIFSTGDAQQLLVDVKENAVGIDVDLTKLSGEEAYFPYAGYSRTAAVRGVKLASTQRYTLVLIPQGNAYKALLLRGEGIEKYVESEQYYTQAEGTAYLTNRVNVCYYPCMEGALAQKRLERGTKLQKLALVALPERDYALVSYAGEKGPTLVYVPLSYLTAVNPCGIVEENYSLGYLKAGETVFTAEDGRTVTVTERTQVRLYRQDDGAYTARFEQDGTVYTATDVPTDMIASANDDALRTSLIVILSVLAVLIIGVYIYLLPLRKRSIK